MVFKEDYLRRIILGSVWECVSERELREKKIEIKINQIKIWSSVGLQLSKFSSFLWVTRWSGVVSWSLDFDFINFVILTWRPEPVTRFAAACDT